MYAFCFVRAQETVSSGAASVLSSVLSVESELPGELGEDDPPPVFIGAAALLFVVDSAAAHVPVGVIVIVLLSVAPAGQETITVDTLEAHEYDAVHSSGPPLKEKVDRSAEVKLKAESASKTTWIFEVFTVNDCTVESVVIV